MLKLIFKKKIPLQFWGWIKKKLFFSDFFFFFCSAAYSNKKKSLIFIVSISHEYLSTQGQSVLCVLGAVYPTMSFISSDVTITAVIVSLTFIFLGVNSIRVLSQIISSGQMTRRPFREVTYTDEDLLHLDEQLG